MKKYSLPFQLNKYSKHKICLALLLSLATTSYTFAEGGFYMGIGAGYASLNNNLQNNYVYNNGNSGNQTSGNVASTLYFGYDFNHYIGLQGEYNVAYDSTVANSYNVNQQLLGVSALLHLPFSLISDSLAGLSVFGKIGADYDVIGFSNVSPNCANCTNPPSSAFGYVPLYGAGIEYGQNNIGVRLEWDQSGNINASNMGSTQSIVNSNMYLISILYHF
jgi:hypothetical protein